MIRVLLFSVLLLAGMVVSQLANLPAMLPALHWVTMACLGYIMIEVGLEFSADMKSISHYIADYWIAAAAAALPWLFCVIYFILVLKTPWKEASLVGQFAAPTSAGVLFTMLAAVGLGGTWVFKKARVLAIFDDLETLLLIIILQTLFLGLQWQPFVVLGLTVLMLGIAYRWINRLHWPTGKPWLLLYGSILTGLCGIIQRVAHIHLEVLVPAFALGCLIHHQSSIKEGDDPHSWLDQGVKASFMFLVGCSLPRVPLDQFDIGAGLAHVIALTLLSNVGKCFPLLCYRDEAGLRDRLALSIAMFPRGEVGAGVLLIALNNGIKGLPVIYGSLSLALNLLLTGVFIMLVAKLIRHKAS